MKCSGDFSPVKNATIVGKRVGRKEIYYCHKFVRGNMGEKEHNIGTGKLYCKTDEEKKLQNGILIQTFISINLTFCYLLTEKLHKILGILTKRYFRG